MYRISFVHKLTKVLIDVMFFGGLVACAFVPFIMGSAAEAFGYSSSATRWMTVMLMISGGCAVYILFQLKSIFKSLMVGNPFTMKNVSYLRRISVGCFLISMTFLIKCIFWFTFATGLIVIIFALVGLFTLTLKDLFKQAVHYKEENDFTV